MMRDINTIKRLLREKLMDGFDPSWDPESAEDHWIDWMALSRAEFEAIKAAAKAEKLRLVSVAA